MTPALLVACCAFAVSIAPDTWRIDGVPLPGRQPDGNTYVVEGDEGLLVIDTGRHASHRAKIEALAAKRQRPVVAIVNTHWHLDHVSGNAALKQRWPRATVLASDAIDRALDDFLAKGADASRRALADPALDPVIADELRIDLDTVDHGEALKPDVIVDGPRTLAIGTHAFEVRLARDAATAGDVWLFDPATRIAFVGDLVTFPAAFLDTACPRGWSRALGEIDALPFDRVAPGHGPLLSRAAFRTWRQAFDALVACAASDTPATRCADAWVAGVRDVGGLSDADPARGRAMTMRDVDAVLRAHGGRSRYCLAADG